MKTLVVLILLIFKLWILVKKITNSKFASKIPMGCFQKIKSQTHLFNVISQADCNVLALSALLKQKKKGRKKKREEIKRRSESSDFFFFFSSPFYANICFLNGVFWETLQSNSENELWRTGSLTIWWKINLHLCDYFQRKLTWFSIHT